MGEQGFAIYAAQMQVLCTSSDQNCEEKLRTAKVDSQSMENSLFSRCIVMKMTPRIQSIHSARLLTNGLSSLKSWHPSSTRSSSFPHNPGRGGVTNFTHSRLNTLNTNTLTHGRGVTAPGMNSLSEKGGKGTDSPPLPTCHWFGGRTSPQGLNEL